MKTNLTPFQRHAHACAIQAELEGFQGFAAALRKVAARAELSPLRPDYGRVRVGPSPFGAVERPAVSPTLDR
jgi:hypothetical protein